MGFLSFYRLFSGFLSFLPTFLKIFNFSNHQNDLEKIPTNSGVFSNIFLIKKIFSHRDSMC